MLLLIRWNFVQTDSLCLMCLCLRDTTFFFSISFQVLFFAGFGLNPPFTSLTTRKQFNNCGFYASCVCQQGSSLKVAMSMHHVFANKEAIQKLWYQYIIPTTTKKQFKSCGFYASCICQQGCNLKVVVSMHNVAINREVV